jgi:hypothetical protein
MQLHYTFGWKGIGLGLCEGDEALYRLEVFALPFVVHNVGDLPFANVFTPFTLVNTDTSCGIDTEVYRETDKWGK